MTEQLTQAQKDALRDARGYNKLGWGYRFKPKTMERLAQLGMVRVDRDTGNAHGYWLTESGHDALTEETRT